MSFLSQSVKRSRQGKLGTRQLFLNYKDGQHIFGRKEEFILTINFSPNEIRSVVIFWMMFTFFRGREICSCATGERAPAAVFPPFSPRPRLVIYLMATYTLLFSLLLLWNNQWIIFAKYIANVCIITETEIIVKAFFLLSGGSSKNTAQE